MNLPLRPLGDYIRLLAEHGLLAGPHAEAGPPAGADLDREVALVTCDSRSAVPGTLFICKGVRFKPAYLDQAAERGAFCYLSEVPYPASSLPALLVSDVRTAMALLANFYYNEPWRELRVVGITGTKGKSSAAYFIKSIFDTYMAQKGGQESGLISSIATYDGVERFPSRLTTPEPLDVERHLANALGRGLEFLTMEVSSQALKYGRVLGLEFSAAVFLNIGVDHISAIEHPDFEDYFSSKLRIFSQCAAACVNLDSDHAGRVLDAARHGEASRVITFSRHDPGADVFAGNIRKLGHDTLFRVRTPRYERELRLCLPGQFNVENALAAVAAAECFALSPDCVETGLLKARVPGRMEPYVSAGGTVVALVDFAHNKLSFETLLRAAREEYPEREIAVVFGCPGARAPGRREDMGILAGQCASRVYLTEDDAGEEDPAEICRQIAVHVLAQGRQPVIELDREAAIRRAVFDCRRPSVVLVAGKGSEDYQLRGAVHVPYPTDGVVTERILREYDEKVRS